jgi:hypothetical protein
MYDGKYGATFAGGIIYEVKAPIRLFALCFI